MNLFVVKLGICCQNQMGNHGRTSWTGNALCRIPS